MAKTVASASCRRIDFMPDNAIDENADDIVARLKNKDTRLICAMALCLSGKEKYIRPVIDIMDKIIWDEVEDLSYSLRGFGRSVVPFLIPVAHSSKKASAACAMRALGLIGGTEAIEVLVERLVALPSKSEPTEALVTIGIPAIPSLLSITNHGKADVRAMAVFALGKIGDQSALERIETITENDRSEKVQDVANLASSWLRGEDSCGVDLRNSFGELPS
jgi:hypothetical protein